MGWVIGAPRLASLWPTRLTYCTLPGLPPFRERETAGALSTGAGLIFGLDRAMTPDAAQNARTTAVRADPCTALFGLQTDSRLNVRVQAGTVQYSTAKKLSTAWNEPRRHSLDC